MSLPLVPTVFIRLNFIILADICHFLLEMLYFGRREASTCLIMLDPVVQSIVSLTISLRHKFVKQISAKVILMFEILTKR